MKDRIQKRLATLRIEFQTGQAKLQHLEREQHSVRETLLRISGAIQVLEEILDERQSPNSCSSAKETIHGNTS